MFHYQFSLLYLVFEKLMVLYLQVKILLLSFFHHASIHAPTLNWKVGESAYHLGFEANKDYVMDPPAPKSTAFGKIARGGAERSIPFFRYDKFVNVDQINVSLNYVN